MKKKINLALQGGGAHGAYTWGVLDRLLEDERLQIEAISGTSAGAMNAAILTSGYARGGSEGAKTALKDFWKGVSDIYSFSPLYKNPLVRMLTGWNLDSSPMYQWVELLSSYYSPYDLNPFNLNPLHTLLDAQLDVGALESCSAIRLFLTATNVETGQPRVFECHEINADVVSASACIPQIFQAVEIDGQHYWDGGYMGNPAIWPLIYHADCLDIMLVQINPIYRKGVPKRSAEITNRLNEITFNSSLIAEMRAIRFVKKLVKEGRLDDDRYKDLRIHLIQSPDEFERLNASSKMNGAWDFLLYLHGKGYNAAGQWLDEHYDHIGNQTTADIDNSFLGGPSQPARELREKNSA